MSRLFYVLAFVFLMSAPLNAQAQKVVVVDLDRAISQSKAGKNMNSQLEAQSKVVQGKVEKIQKDLQAEASKLEEQRNLMAPDALRIKGEELRLKQVTKQQEISVEARSIQAGGQEALKKVAEIAVAELKTLSEEKKADIVLRRETVLIVSPSSDLTDELVARIDKKITSVKVTPIKDNGKQ